MKKININALASITMLILIFSIFIFQFYNYKKYEISSRNIKQYNEISKGLVIEDLKVITEIKLEGNVTYKDITLNVEENFICKEKDKKLICNNNDASIVISDGYTYVDLFKNGKIKNSIYNKINKKQIIEDNKIKNDIDLFGYIKETKNNHLFTSHKIMSEAYAFRMFACEEMPNINSIYLLEGHIEGYILNLDNAKEVHFNYKNKNYTLIFKNTKYFNDQLTEKILSSIN